MTSSSQKAMLDKICYVDWLSAVKFKLSSDFITIWHSHKHALYFSFHLISILQNWRSCGYLRVEVAWLPSDLDFLPAIFKRPIFWDHIESPTIWKYECDICIDTLDIALKTCPRNDPLLNMNIEANIDSRAVT